jgi:amino acid transporter
MRDLWNSLTDALSAVTTIVGVVVMMATGWAVIWTWIKGWDWMQKGVMIFVALCLIFLLLLSINAWWRKTKIYRIPNLLFRLEEIIRNYVDNYDPTTITATDKRELALDLAELLNILTVSY